MDDERIPGGTLFRFEYLCDGRRRERVSAKAINGFGGKGDRTTSAEDRRSLVNIGGFASIEMECWWHFGYGSGSEARSGE